MSIIIPANSAAAGLGYQVTNSLRFNGATNSDECLIKTFGSGGDRKKWTYSVWFKMSGRGQGNNNALLIAGVSGQSEGNIKIAPDKIDWSEYNVSTGGNTGRLTTSQELRDYSAWYHLVCVWDTANSTAGDRMIMYLNGSRITSYGTNTNPPINTDSQINNNNIVHNIGRQSWNNSGEFNGYMSEICFIDGQALAPTSFGEFDGDSGIWKPKDDLTDLTFGDTGFYLEFKQSGTGTNSSGMGADTSGEDNHWAVNNLTAVSQTTDTCTNNFATMNPLDNFYQAAAFSDGNLTITTTNTAQSYNTSSIMVSSGKWYVECKVVSGGSEPEIGVANKMVGETNGNNAQLSYNANGYAYRANGQVWYNGSSVGGTWASYANGDIIGIAINLDTLQSGLNKLYFSKNGAFQNGADPTDFSSVTGVVGIVQPANTLIGAYAFGANENFNDNNKVFSWNFGNAPYSISSGNTDANDHGNFEYAVPSGFLALCTANLSEVGS